MRSCASDYKYIQLCSLFSASVGLCTFGDRLNEVDRCENSHWDKGLKGPCPSDLNYYVNQFKNHLKCVNIIIMYIHNDNNNYRRCIISKLNSTKLRKELIKIKTILIYVVGLTH